MTVRAVMIVVTLVLLTGCGQVTGGTTNGKGTDMDPMEQLEQRPRESDTEERYVRVLASFQERVAQELGVSWSQEPQRSGGAGCGEPFSGLGGVSFNVLGGATQGSFDHADWSKVEAIADAVAQEEGFTGEKVVVVDRPDYKKMAWYDEHGAELEVGADKVLMPAIYGACVLP